MFSGRRMQYPFETVEKKWRSHSSGEEFIHLDQLVGETAKDILSRYQRRSDSQVDQEAIELLVGQGTVLGEDGREMSEGCGNLIEPEEVIGEFGADSLRLYLMFIGPLGQMCIFA